MTSPRHNLSSPLPIAIDGWSEALARDLQIHKPSSIELSGLWPDLAVFTGHADSVTSLRLTGRTKDGQVPSVRGLAAFRNLRHLCVAGKLASKLSEELPPLVESLDCIWQQQSAHWLLSESLKQVHLRAYSGTSLQALRIAPSIERLSLLTPKLSCLELPTACRSLTTLSIVRARELATLAGCEHRQVRELRIRDARKLEDVSAIASLLQLEDLQLVDISPNADLSPIAQSASLARVHVGGTKAPSLPWLALLSLPSLRLADGPWDPSEVSEDALRGASATQSRIRSFQSFGDRGRRPARLELSSATATHRDDA